MCGSGRPPKEPTQRDRHASSAVHNASQHVHAYTINRGKGLFNMNLTGNDG